MFVKITLILLALGCIDASFYDLSRCSTPRIAHGRVRLRQRSGMAKFTCLSRYSLVGNTYATCRNGNWDVPLPVCVRTSSSCRIPRVQNGLSMLSYGGAWVIFFCFPNHELVGSPAIYCDGYKWNASAPICYDTTKPPALSCDFEDPDLCGWKQDALHDFDWLRLNRKTPSSFLFTGPSYDHTLGKGKDGHYMYIESTSQIENDTARLISPVYDSSLTHNGCFSFAYHMYGKTCGTLRVYQKPENITIRTVIDMSEEEKQSYLLFEKRGNLGDKWFNAVSPLKKSFDDFQIIIEGIRGSSYTSDIAIDDVAILQGENCAEAENSATTPPAPTTTNKPDSCVNRCIDEIVVKDPKETGCGCSVGCIIQEICCPDFFEVCIFTPDSTLADTNVSVTAKTASEDAPQTQRLVAVSTESTTTITSNRPTTVVASSPISIFYPWSKTPQRRIAITPRRTSARTPTSTTTASTPSTTKSTTTSTTTSTKQTTTRKPATTTSPSHSTSKSTSKPTFKYTKTTTKLVPSTAKVISTTTVAPKKILTTPIYKVSKPIDNDNYLETVEKAKKEQEIERMKVTQDVKKKVRTEVKVIPQAEGNSASVKVVMIILILAALSATAMIVHAGLRSTRVRIALARFRAHRDRDPEVRYLSSDVDDD